ncbi:signal peptidase II [Hathewaya histolytica]|uniref:signal peptidase II n=1 Tax=Hathewaya histolytica TaxID=1498 RepID=UPI003B66E564
MKESFFVFIFLPIIGMTFFILGNIFKNGIKKKWIFLCSTVLILLDQIMKFLFLNANKASKFNDIGKIISIEPIKNTLASTMNYFLDMKISIMSLIFINLILIIICVSIYKHHINKYNKSLWSDSFIIFIISGLACSLLDKILWRGSIDFINFNNFIIFDFKDIYLILSVFLILFEVILNEKIDIFTK